MAIQTPKDTGTQSECTNCHKGYNPDADGATKVTVALVIADDREPERCTAILELCPACFKETELTDWIMGFSSVVPL